MWSNVENASTDVLTVYLNWATTYAILVATPRPHKAITLPLQTFLLHSPCPAGINSTVLTRSPADLFCGLGVVSRARADCPQLCLGDLAEQTLCHPYPLQQPVYYTSSDSSLDVWTIIAATSEDATVDFTDTGDKTCLVMQMSDNTFQVLLRLMLDFRRRLATRNFVYLYLLILPKCTFLGHLIWIAIRALQMQGSLVSHIPRINGVVTWRLRSPINIWLVCLWSTVRTLKCNVIWD